MIPIVVLDRVRAPGGELVLNQRGKQFWIQLAGVELMNSRDHSSEDELARRAIAKLDDRPRPKVLVGGLGLGFTLRAALDVLPAAARVDVVEIVPAVVRWNREIFGGLAGHPLSDPRVTVIEGDVGNVIAQADRHYDVIVIDVDNGPEGVGEGNHVLYRRTSLAAMLRALTPGGMLGVWSSFQSPTFTHSLNAVGFVAEAVRLRSKFSGGPTHHLWFARRP